MAAKKPITLYHAICIQFTKYSLFKFIYLFPVMPYPVWQTFRDIDEMDIFAFTFNFMVWTELYGVESNIDTFLYTLRINDTRVLCFQQIIYCILHCIRFVVYLFFIFYPFVWTYKMNISMLLSKGERTFISNMVLHSERRINNEMNYLNNPNFSDNFFY